MYMVSSIYVPGTGRLVVLVYSVKENICVVVPEVTLSYTPVYLEVYLLCVVFYPIEFRFYLFVYFCLVVSLETPTCLYLNDFVVFGCFD